MRLSYPVWFRLGRVRGVAFPGVALSNTLDNRTRATCDLSGSLPGSRSCGGRDVLRDRPQKRRHLAGNCGNDQRTLFADGGEPTVTGAQASLRLPGDFANRFGQPLEPRLQGLADAGRIPIAPGTLDQARLLPASVRPARRTRSPVDRSDGTRPRKAISWRGLSNRRKSPISATKVTATPKETQRIA